MKVLVLNGSPHHEGCTATALSEVTDELQRQDISAVWLQVGNPPTQPCIACNACKHHPGRCVQATGLVNEAIRLMEECDGLLVGSPVYFAGPNASLTAFLDQMFYASERRIVQFKPAAAVVSCRRGGASASFDRLNKYFTIAQMPVVPSCYWNSVHGNTPEEVRQDLEGLQVMRALGRNMAWMLKAFAAARERFPLPEQEAKVSTNFIR